MSTNSLVVKIDTVFSVRYKLNFYIIQIKVSLKRTDIFKARKYKMMELAVPSCSW